MSRTERDDDGPLPLARWYNSRQPDGFTAEPTLGVGWSHTYSARLVPVTPRDGLTSDTAGLFYVGADGSYETFVFSPTASDDTTRVYVSAMSAGMTLLLTVEDGEKHWSVVFPDGRRDVFGLMTEDDVWRLTERVSASGQATTLTYDPTGEQLQSVRGPFGHERTFQYDATTGRLNTVTDPATNPIEYHHELVPGSPTDERLYQVT